MDEMSPMTQMNVQKWLEIIHRCRDSGLSNRQWCEENGIGIKSYYYWLSKIRKMAVENLPRKQSVSPSSSVAVCSAPVSFVEIPAGDRRSHGKNPVVIRMGTAVIEIPADTPDTLIQSVIRAVGRC